MDGLLPVGYIEAERYGRDLDRLTGHAGEQNARFIENLDNFILTNFLDFQLWRDGQRRATANIADAPENLERLLEQFLNAGQVQITSPETLARYLARRTRELQTQIATTLTDENSEIYGMFSAFKELLIATLTPADFADMYAQTLAYGLFAARCTLPNATNFSRHTAAEALPKSNPFLVQLFYRVASPTLETNVTLHSGRHCSASSKRPDRDAPHGVCCQNAPRRPSYPLLRDLPRRIRSAATRRSRCLLHTATGYLLYRQIRGQPTENKIEQTQRSRRR